MKGQMTNMTGVGDNDFSPLPIDTEYEVVISEVEDGSSISGDPMFKLTLQVKNSKYAKRRIFDRILISSNPTSKGWNIRWRAKQFLRAIGQPHHGDSFQWCSEDWLYKECKVRLGLDTYKGKTQNKVLEYLPYEPVPSQANNLEVDF